MPTHKVKNTKTAAIKKTAPFTIDEQLDCGEVTTGDNQAIGISLVRHEHNRYLSLSKLYVTKEGLHKNRGGMWIPFAHLEDVIGLMSNALNKGIANGWDKAYEPCNEQCDHSDTQTDTSALADITDLIQQAQEVSMQLQKQLETAKAMQLTNAEKSSILNKIHSIFT